MQLKPNNGRPENQLPHTPCGLELYRSHKALEGADSVLPAQDNDPRNRCEPLGMPRYNHYNVRLTQIFQDEHKVVILYHYDNRWRVIWTDGRQLPKVVDGGVEIAGEIREPRYFGYSVGRWVDDFTLEVQTVGTMSEDRVWLDSTGRPVSDQVRVTERFQRVDYDTLVWSETIEDPKVHETMGDAETPDAVARSPHRYPGVLLFALEQENYNKLFGNTAVVSNRIDEFTDLRIDELLGIKCASLQIPNSSMTVRKVTQ